MNGVIRGRCPRCGGKIIYSEFYQNARDYTIRKDGKVPKRYVSRSGELSESVAACENGCGAYWEDEDFPSGKTGCSTTINTRRMGRNERKTSRDPALPVLRSESVPHRRKREVVNTETGEAISSNIGITYWKHPETPDCVLGFGMFFLDTPDDIQRWNSRTDKAKSNPET